MAEKSPRRSRETQRYSGPPCARRQPQRMHVCPQRRAPAPHARRSRRTSIHESGPTASLQSAANGHFVHAGIATDFVFLAASFGNRSQTLPALLVSACNRGFTTEEACFRFELRADSETEEVGVTSGPNAGSVVHRLAVSDWPRLAITDLLCGTADDGSNNACGTIATGSARSPQAAAADRACFAPGPLDLRHGESS